MSHIRDIYLKLGIIHFQNKTKNNKNLKLYKSKSKVHKIFLAQFVNGTERSEKEERREVML